MFERSARTDGLASLLARLQPESGPDTPESAPEAPDNPPEIDLAALQAASFEEGFAAGQRAGEAEITPLIEGLKGAIKAFEAACTIDVDRLRPVLATLVRSVAERVLMTELAAGAHVLMPLVDAALAQVSPAAEPVLRAHPEVLAALGERLGQLLTVADPALPRDGFQVEGTEFIVSVGLQARLDALLEGLE